jgi:hypothetical protein
LKVAKRGRKYIVFDEDPKKLVSKVLAKLKELGRSKKTPRTRETS